MRFGWRENEESERAKRRKGKRGGHVRVAGGAETVFRRCFEALRRSPLASHARPGRPGPLVRQRSGREAAMLWWQTVRRWCVAVVSRPCGAPPWPAMPAPAGLDP